MLTNRPKNERTVSLFAHGAGSKPCTSWSIFFDFRQGLLQGQQLISRCFGGVIGTDRFKAVKRFEQPLVVFAIQAYSNTLAIFVHYEAFFRQSAARCC